MKKLKICMVVFSYYPADVRVRREAEAIAKEGISVDVICLRNLKEPAYETVNGIHIHRLPIQRKRTGKLRYYWQYIYFIFLSSLKLSLLHIVNRYQIVHVHNMPDILVLCAILPKVTGSKIILDLHDPMPEIYMTKYTVGENHLYPRMLRLIEKYSIKFSDLVLTPNIGFRELFIARGCPAKKIHIIMNSPDETIFGKKNYSNIYNKSESNKFYLMYHGTIAERNGLDIALHAISQLKDKIPNLVFQVYGGGDFVERFLQLVDSLNLRFMVNYHGYVPSEDIVKAIECIDVGIIPNKRNPFTEINLPTRIFEYLSMYKPAIVPRTRGIIDYFDENSLYFFEPGNVESLKQVILETYREKDNYGKILEMGITVYNKYSWNLQRQYLIELVLGLTNTNS